MAHACVRARSVQRDGGDGKGRKSRVHWCGGRAAAKRRGGNGFCGGHERDARRRHSRPFLSPPRWRNSEGGTRRRGDGRSTISSDIERAVHTKREGCMYLCVRDGDETGYSIWHDEGKCNLERERGSNETRLKLSGGGGGGERTKEPLSRPQLCFLSRT